MTTKENYPSSDSPEELYRQNLALRAELSRTLTSRDYIWTLFVEASRRLQMSSASIKAAVSSLLNNEIFWDPGNQHEFLKTIDTSVDKVAHLVLLFTLAFRAEAGSLELKQEPQSLQEILAVVQANVASRLPKLMVRFLLPKEGKPVMVDYEYLSIAIGFLFELFDIGKKSQKIQAQAIENQQNWFLEIVGMDDAILDLIQNMHDCKTVGSTVSKYAYLPEQILGLHVACEIFHLQNINLEVDKNSEKASVLRLIVPIFVNSPLEP